MALGVDEGLFIYCTAEEPPSREMTVRHLGNRLHCFALRLDGDLTRLDTELDRLCAHIRVLCRRSARVTYLER